MKLPLLPDKVPCLVSEGLSWTLKPNTDLVLQMHLHPSGRDEIVKPAIALYFTDQPPTNVPFRFKLARFDFEIPAGADNYLVEQSYVLPVDVRLLRVLPHAHYLGKRLQAYAELPTGKRQWLIWIKDWDFNWQGDYKYAEPVSLPKGARLVMHYTYDNSTNNVRNPNQPPKRRDTVCKPRTKWLVWYSKLSRATRKIVLSWPRITSNTSFRSAWIITDFGCV